MSLDTAKLLTAEEIENRLYNTEIKILELRKIKNQIARGVAAEFYRLNPVIEEDIKYPLQQRKKISSQLKIPFDHFDLYFFRMRSSKKYFKLLEENKESKFFEKQLNLSLNTITNTINPKIIFVANKEASDIFLSHFNKNIKFDEKEGFHILTLSNKRIPVFFSGMISSARSVDNYTLERIVWHIRQALKFHEGNNR